MGCGECVSGLPSLSTFHPATGDPFRVCRRDAGWSPLFRSLTLDWLVGALRSGDGVGRGPKPGGRRNASGTTGTGRLRGRRACCKDDGDTDHGSERASCACSRETDRMGVATGEVRVSRTSPRRSGTRWDRRPRGSCGAGSRQHQETGTGWPFHRLRRNDRDVPASLVARILEHAIASHEEMPPLQTGKRGRQKRRIGHNLALRLQKYKEGCLRFLTDPRTPFSNNQAERDLRMGKLRQKISGGFRSMQGACDFANLRSVIATARKSTQTAAPRRRAPWRPLRIYCVHGTLLSSCRTCDGDT